MSQDIFENSQSTPTPSSSNLVSTYSENVSPSKKCKLIQTKLPISYSITLTPASNSPQTSALRNCPSSPLSKSSLSSRTRGGRNNRKPQTQRIKHSTNEDDYDYFGENTQDANLSIYTSSSTQDDSTVPPFTIHRIAAEKLQLQKLPGTTSSPEQVIDGIMQQINEKYDKSSKERFEPFVSPVTSTFVSQSTQDVTFFAIAYVQKLYDQDKFLRHLKIDEGTQRLNKIIFYYKAGVDSEIFALTFGSTWQTIQPFCCSDFSYKIAGRLAAVENPEHTSRICTLMEYLNDHSKHNANAPREFRHDASIFWLDEFSSFTNTASPKVRFGQTSIQIEKPFHPENIPELLHHFSKILAGRETFTFPDGIIERQVNDRPMIRLATANESKLASDYFYRLLQSYLRSSNESYNQTIKELNLVLRNLNNSHRAIQFQLVHFAHNNGNTSKSIQGFSSCPTAFQVLSALRSNCSDLTAPMDVVHLRTKFGNVKLSFVLNGERQECKLIDILEGRVFLTKEGLGDFFRICGQWWAISDEFFLDVHHKFLDFLRTQSVLLYPGEPGHLSAKWDPNSMHSVKDYLKEFHGGNSHSDGNYFSFPSGFDKVKSYHFDLLHVSTNIGSSQGSDKHIYLYYIFDRFDPGIRSYCSESVLKSLESLIDPASRILGEFYNSNKNAQSFQKLFPTFEQFSWNILHGSVFIVVAFVTEEVRNCNKSSRPENKQSIKNYFQTSPSKDGHPGKREDRRIRSLYHEATLQTCFSKGNLKTFVWNRLPQTMRDKLCLELNVSRKQVTNEDLTERIVSRLLDKLILGEYCRPNSTSGSDDECEKEVTGKLLRMRSFSEFKLFQSEEINKELIHLIQPYFISQFPGISHKLECLRIYEIVQNKWPHFKIHFMEIETVASKRD